VRGVARERKEMKFNALLQYLTVALLRDSFYALKRKAAPGADGVTWQEYETGLEVRLGDPHSRVHRGAYRPQPSRRVYIPKPDADYGRLGLQRWRQDGSTGRSYHPLIRFMRSTFGVSRMVSARAQPAPSAGRCHHAE
jgi:hypothetical protein